jgi:hypothetical protein
VTGARRRALRLLTAASVASLLAAVPSMSLAAPPDDSAPPDFQAPWACGETWYGATYPDHGNGDRALDFNGADDAEAGQAVLASAPGVVHITDTEFFESADRRVMDGKLRMADETELDLGDDGDGGADVSLWRFNGQVYIDHGSGWYSFYAHLDPSLPSVREGAEVETGDVLGYVDQEPNPVMALGAHLHYEQKHDAREPFSVYQARTQRLHLQAGTLPVLGRGEFAAVTSLNCEGDRLPADLALQPTGFADDLVAVRDAGARAIGIRRHLVDSASEVLTSRERMNVRPARAANGVLAGDFTNDGVDDIALAIQQRDGSFQIKVWSEGRYRVGSYTDPGYRYSLGLNQGRLAAGDFDGDGFTDDIVMAKAIGTDRTRLVRFLFDGPGSVTVSRLTLNLRPARLGDRMLVGDFTNDDADDVAFVIQQRDGSFQVRVWQSADTAAGVYFDPNWRYMLSANQGRLISGDFDGDGYADDIAMARRLDAQHLGLRRFLTDGPRTVAAGEVTIRMQPYRVHDRMVRGDFDNDGADDAAFVVRHHDGRFRVQAWSGAGGDAPIHIDRRFGRADGLVVSGNFDRS